MRCKLAGEAQVAISFTGNQARLAGPIHPKRRRFRRPFVISNAKQCIYAAMQTANCCYANKSVVTGIWYT